MYRNKVIIIATIQHYWPSRFSTRRCKDGRKLKRVIGSIKNNSPQSSPPRFYKQRRRTRWSWGGGWGLHISFDSSSRSMEQCCFHELRSKAGFLRVLIDVPFSVNVLYLFPTWEERCRVTRRKKFAISVRLTIIIWYGTSFLFEGLDFFRFYIGLSM